MAVTKELRFAMDEKGMKNLAPTLVGQRISYWVGDADLRHGVVKTADIYRDRYGKPYIEVELEEEGEAAAAPPAAEPEAAAS